MAVDKFTICVLIKRRCCWHYITFIEHTNLLTKSWFHEWIFSDCLFTFVPPTWKWNFGFFPSSFRKKHLGHVTNAGHRFQLFLARKVIYLICESLKRQRIHLHTEFVCDIINVKPTLLPGGFVSHHHQCQDLLEHNSFCLF